LNRAIRRFDGGIVVFHPLEDVPAIDAAVRFDGIVDYRGGPGARIHTLRN